MLPLPCRLEFVNVEFANVATVLGSADCDDIGTSASVSYYAPAKTGGSHCYWGTFGLCEGSYSNDRRVCPCKTHTVRPAARPHAPHFPSLTPACAPQGLWRRAGAGQPCTTFCDEIGKVCKEEEFASVTSAYLQNTIEPEAGTSCATSRDPMATR